jgi:TP901 family phage tail tape measure protein
MANVVGRIPVGADTRPLEKDISRAFNKSYQLKGLNDKAFSQPLGRITGSVDEFRKSLDASNARVLAFGASAGAIFAVQRGFQKLITSTINVQKNLTDINSILGLTSKNLTVFGDQLFKIASQTGQSFETISAAAVEFSRQGLGVEETLRRTRDALILTRLSGLDVVASTQALTATINSFNKVALDSTQIVNKLATVDAAFAVSSGDLAEAIRRVGSSADSVGVNLDQLLALVTSVQQTTARGGAVIGNSLKTIFTRLGRTEVLDQLEQLGIQARNVDGSFRPAIETLSQLAVTFDGLSDAQRGNVAELVGGVFQINILKAALGDLSKQYSIYNSALSTSSGATDAAVKRNEQLNQTLSSLVNKTSVNFTKLAADIGGLTLGPAIEGILANINSALESFNLSDAKGPGETLAKGLLEGLGNYISGPGLALIGAVLGKLFINLAKFSGQAVGQILDINKGAQQQAELQQRINSILAQNPNLIQGILNKQISLLSVENDLLKVIQAQTLAREQSARISTTIAGNLIGRGVTATGGKVSAKSGGFIPNFASAEQSEVYGAYLGGYKPGPVSRMNIPGEGSIVYNKAEQVKQFPGMTQPAIMPPQESSAGKNYAQAFQSKLGFNPYASDGFVPNFSILGMARQSYLQQVGSKQNLIMIRATEVDAAQKAGIQIFMKTGLPFINKADRPKLTLAFKKFEEGSAADRAAAIKQEKGVAGFANKSGAAKYGIVFPSFGQNAVGESAGYAGEGKNRKAYRFKTFPFPSKDFDINEKLYNDVRKNLIDISTNYFRGLLTKPQIVDTNRFKTNIQSNLSRSAVEASVGQIFEAGIKSSISTLSLNEIANFDLDAGELGRIRSRFKLPYQFSGTSFADLKNSLSTGNLNSMAAKINKYENPSKKSKALGFIPNYSKPLIDSMRREISAGISPSRIRVGQDSRLSNSENPMGLGVYNTKDEPAGLGQGIARFKKVFDARKSGAAKGFVPNYAARAFDSDYRQKVLNSRGLTTGGNKVPFGRGGGTLAASILLPTIAGAISSSMPEDNTTGRAISSGLGNIGSYAFTGAALGGGVPGAVIGGAVGIALTLLDVQKQLDEKPFKILEKSIQLSQEKLNLLNDTFSRFNGISEKLNQAYTGNIRSSTQELAKLQSAQVAALASLPAETRNAILEALGKGDTLKVQQIQTEILETQQSKVKAQQAEQAAEALNLAKKPGFMDMVFSSIANVGTGEGSKLTTPEEIRQEYLKGNPQEIEKVSAARKAQLEEITNLIVEDSNQSIGEIIAKLSDEGLKSEEIKPKLLQLKSGFKNVALYAEYIKDLDIKEFLNSLNQVKEANDIGQINTQRVQGAAKDFLNSLENNITETNRIFSEGETNIANVTAQIQSRRGTFLESIKDLYGEFTQLNVSQQFDDAIRNAEYERSRLQITRKIVGNLNNLGANQIDSFRNNPGKQQTTIDFISKMQENISNLKGITDPTELAKQARSLSEEYYQKNINDPELKDQSRALADELQKVARDAEDASNQLKALDSSTANSKRLADQEYIAREKLLRVQQAISFAGGIRSYQQNAFPGMAQDFNNARMNLGSSNAGTRGRGALGILDQLKQLGIGPSNLPKELTDTAQRGLEAGLKKYLTAIGQNLSPEKIKEIAKTQINNYAKRDEAMAVNIPNIDKSVGEIYKELKDTGIKISNIEELARALNGDSGVKNPSTATGQPTNQAGQIISNNAYTARLSPFTPAAMGSGPFYKGKLFNELQNQGVNPGSISTEEGIQKNVKIALDAQDMRENLESKIAAHAVNISKALANQSYSAELILRDTKILDDTNLSILERVQKINDLHGRDLQLAERQEKFRTDQIDHMNDILDLANGYLTSVEYANKELERQQNLARLPGYNPLLGAGQSFVNEMSYNGAQLFQDINTSAVSVARNIKDSFSNAFQSFMNGTETAGDAFTNFSIQVLQQISQISTDLSTKLLFGGISKQFQGLFGDANMDLGGLFGFSKGGLVKGYARGGLVTDGSGIVDDVPAVLSKGEFVINRRAVKSLQEAYGVGFLNSLNSNTVGRYAEGGIAFNKDFDNKYEVTGFENTQGLNTKDIGGGISALQAYMDQMSGRTVISPELSNFAITDTDNRQNSERMQAEQDFYDYQVYLNDVLNQNKYTKAQAEYAYQLELDAFNRQKKQRLEGAFMSMIMGVVGAGLSSGLGGMGGAAAGGTGFSGASLGGSTGFGASFGVGSAGTAVSSSSAVQAASRGGLGGIGNLFGGGNSGLNMKSLGGVALLGAGTFGAPMLASMLQSYPKAPRLSTSSSSGLKQSSRFRFAEGGMAQDDVPALLMNGEYVVNKDTVQKYGSTFFEKLNKGQISKFAQGGLVSKTSGSSTITNFSAENPSPESSDIRSLVTTLNDLTIALESKSDSQEITNNISISVNIEKDGKTTEVSSSGSDEDEDKNETNKDSGNKMKALTDLIKDNVLKTIIDQKRPGGLLSKSG